MSKKSKKEKRVTQEQITTTYTEKPLYNKAQLKFLGECATNLRGEKPPIKILTSYYDNIQNIPKEYILISVSGGISKAIEESVDLWDRTLAPSLSIYDEYSASRDHVRYTERFTAERLTKINWEDKIRNWEALFPNRTLVLLCYEKPDEFCHRHLLAEAIFRSLGITVAEFSNDSYIDSAYLQRLENKVALESMHGSALCTVQREDLIQLIQNYKALCPTTPPVIPAEAHSLEVFSLNACETSPSGKEAYIGFKLENGDFHFISVPYTGPVKEQAVT